MAKKTVTKQLEEHKALLTKVAKRLNLAIADGDLDCDESIDLNDELHNFLGLDIAIHEPIVLKVLIEDSFTLPTGSKSTHTESYTVEVKNKAGKVIYSGEPYDVSLY